MLKIKCPSKDNTELLLLYRAKNYKSPTLSTPYALKRVKKLFINPFSSGEIKKYNF